MAHKVRLERVRRDLTQVELAGLAKVNAATISRVESGGKVSPLVQGRIARALGLSVADLFPEAEEVSA